MNKEQIEFIVKNIILHNSELSIDKYKQKEIVSTVIDAVENATLNFTNMDTIILNQNGKTRVVKKYTDILSPENILCSYIKHILDKKFKITYPNRNKVTKSLFTIFSAIIQMTDFTVIRFDFKNYFNTISSEYVFEKYIKDNISKRSDLYLISEFVKATKFTYAGLCTSNAIAEIISKHFDNALNQNLLPYGVVFYERYIDDGIIILNEHVEQNLVIDILKKALIATFKDENIDGQKCRTKLNLKKFQYISKRNISQTKAAINFLGYEFYLSNNNNKNDTIKIEYGITSEKRKKYEKKVNKLISKYTSPLSEDYHNIELLRHRIAAFSSRQVYMTQYKGHTTWHVKGFISNYGELRYFLKAGLIEEKTQIFLQNMIEDAFKKANLTPYFLKGNKAAQIGTGGKNTQPTKQHNSTQDSLGYNLYYSMQTNKTMLFVQRIGYNYNGLVKLCKKIGINNNTNHKIREYNSLLRAYLIKVKVGY